MSDTRQDVRDDRPSSFAPARILLVDIDRPLPAVPSVDPHTGHSYRRALAVVRLHTHPLGIVELPLPEGELSAHDHAQLIWSALEQEITEHLRDDNMPTVPTLGQDGLQWTEVPLCLETRAHLLADPPLVSVVIATRDRPELLERCLESLLTLNYPRYEIILVDNAPSNDATRQLVSAMAREGGPCVRYVREDQPGLSSARNRGLLEASGEVVAFTDDDVRADQGWLCHLVAGFRRVDNVVCVTGNILPMEMETPAQSFIEQFGGFSKGFARRVYDMGDHRISHPLYPYTAGGFGSGANLAFQAQTLRQIGGFDPALGAGTRALGGEDLAVLFKIVTRGFRLVYEPAAILRHQHRRDYSGLRDQVFGYGVGLTAYLTGCVLEDPKRLLDILRRVPYGLWFTLGPRSSKNRHKAREYPSELTRLELLGMACGPLAYLRSRWHRRAVLDRMGRR